ncbi:MAG: restriction endonuclease subunit S [Saprospiraceae bacterium]|nr:restriction endonuclease subunit S [Saprospiraceae bacterium]
MDSWKSKTIRQLSTNVSSGFACNKSFEVANGYVHLRTHNIDTSGNLNTDLFIKIDPKKVDPKKSTLKAGDVLFNNTNSTELVGKTALVKENFNYAYSNHLTKIKFDQDKILPGYAVYYLNKLWLDGYFARICKKWIGQSGVNSNVLKEIEIPFPLITDQKRIVSKLDDLFKNIEKAIILLVENISHSQALINSVLDEEFGKLELKYTSKPLAEIVRVINGRAYKQTEMFDSGKYPILRVGNFFSNRGWYYSDMELDESKYCEKGDLLYAWSASFGPKIWDGEKSIYHYHIWKMVPTSDKVSRKYMYYLLERDTDKIKEENGRGVGMIHITKGYIESRMMVLPPIEIQEKVVERIEKFYSLHTNITLELNQKLENLKALKSSLLDQAFKGEL